jgi:hypothetical protein
MTSVPEQDEQLTKIYIDLPNHWWLKGESFWAKSLGDDLFEIQNVPFCAYGLNFGDVVKAIQQSPDLKPEIIEVVRKSGNQTLRVHFMVDRDQQQTHINNIEARQAWVERANAKFMSFGTFSTYIQPKQVYGPHHRRTPVWHDDGHRPYGMAMASECQRQRTRRPTCHSCQLRRA